MNSTSFVYCPPDKWGQWRFDAPRLCLIHEGLDYEIDLERINTCAQMLDWIFQIRKKVDDYEFENFVRALDDIFSPQAQCCSYGKDKQFSGTSISSRYADQIIAHKAVVWTRKPKAMDFYY
jgi:hypothetical protein